MVRNPKTRRPLPHRTWAGPFVDDSDPHFIGGEMRQGAVADHLMGPGDNGPVHIYSQRVNSFARDVQEDVTDIDCGPSCFGLVTPELVFYRGTCMTFPLLVVKL
jgi:hypothetical protein